MCFVRGLCKQAPTNGVIVDVGWTPTVVSQGRSVSRFYRKPVTSNICMWSNTLALQKKKNGILEYM